MPINQEDFILRFRADTKTASAEVDQFLKKIAQAEAALGRLSGNRAGAGKIFETGLVDKFGRSISTVTKAEEALVAATSKVTASVNSLAKSKDVEVNKWIAGEAKIRNALAETQRQIRIREVTGRQPTPGQIGNIQTRGEEAVALAAAAPAGVTAQATALRTAGQAAIAYSAQLKTAAASTAALAATQKAEAVAAAAATKAAVQQSAAMAAEDAVVKRLTAALADQQRKLAQSAEFNQKPNITAVNTARQTAISLERATAGTERFRSTNILAAKAVADLSAQQAILKPRVDATTQAFTRHTLTIAQGLIVYNAFSAALQGTRDAIETVISTSLETTRLGLVLGGLSETQSDKFLATLGETAIQTNTSFVDLVATTDLVAGALAGFGDQSKDARLDLINDFQRLAGEFSNLVGSGADLEIVDKQLVTLFNIFKPSFTGIEDFRNLLDQIVTLNNKNATGIQATTDALEASGLAAQKAGFSAEFLTSIISKLVFTSQKSGQEIGGLLTTILAKLTDPAILADIEELTGGIVEVRNEAGGLKEADVILAQIALHQKEIAEIAPGRLSEVISKVGQDINPGAAAFNAQVLKAVLDSFNDLKTGVVDYKDALSDANRVLAETLSFKFGAFVQKLTVGIQSIKDQIKTVLIGLLDFGNSVLSILQALGPGFLVGATQIAAFLAATGLINTVGPRLIAFFTSWKESMLLTWRESGRVVIASSAVAGAATQQAVATDIAAASARLLAIEEERLAIASGGAATGLVTAGAAADAGAVGFSRMRAAAGLLGGVLKTFIPILAIIAGIEIAGTLIEQAKQIDNLVKTLGVSRADAERLVHPTGAVPLPSVGGVRGVSTGSPSTQGFTASDITLGSGQKINAPVSEDERKALSAFLEAVQQIQEAGESVGDKQAVINARIKLATEALVDQGGAYISTATGAQFYVNAANKVSDATQTEQERLQALFAQLQAGEITVDEFAEAWLTGAEAVGKMTEAERIEIATQESLALTTAAAGAAIMNLSSEYAAGKINLDDYTSGLDAIGQAQEIASELVGVFGDSLRDVIPELSGAGEGTEALTVALFNMLARSGSNIGAIKTLTDRILQLHQTYINIANQIRANPLIIKTGILGADKVLQFFSLLPDIFGIRDQVRKMLANYVSSGAFIASAAGPILSNIGAVSSGFGGSGSTASTPQTSVLDIGELSPDQIAKIVAIATQLRNAIPGETAASKGEVVSLIKDASFLTNIKDIDDRLLRIAIDELTQQMEEANRLKEKEQILQNLVVRTGPLSSLISQPTTFGVGGNLASGTGLNFDPTKGNFTINVPVELNGLDPAGLQQLIYNIIYKAIADALRL